MVDTEENFKKTEKKSVKRKKSHTEGKLGGWEEKEVECD